MTDPRNQPTRQVAVKNVKNKKTVLVIAKTNLSRDPRVYRQLIFLAQHYNLIAAGLDAPNLPGVEFVQLPAQQPPNRWRYAHRLLCLIAHQYHLLADKLTASAFETCRLPGSPPDLIIANDLNMLYLGYRLARSYNAKLLLDAHEMEPWNCTSRTVGRLRERYRRWLFRTHIPRVDAMVSVNEAIAEHYKQTYGVPCGVVTNAPFFEDQAPKAVSDSKITLVHHGGVNSSRRLDNLFTLVDQLDERFTLDLMLLTHNRVIYDELLQMAASRPRITFREPVPMPQIARRLNDYDIGIHMLNPGIPNQKLCLPNKLFEFVQGRLAVAVWPSPEMARVVRRHDLGVVSDDFTVASLAAKINALTARDLQRHKANAHTAARVLCAESNQAQFLALVARLIGV